MDGKVALVTGSTKGIGLACALRLGLDGASVVVCSRRQKNVDDAVQLLKDKGVADVFGIAVHVGKSADQERLVAAVVERYGRVDVFVSNVATNPAMGTMLESTTEKIWDVVFSTNVKSHFFLTKRLVPHMKAGSNIVFISSYAGYLPSPILGVYSLTKTTLLALTRVLSRELGPRGIRVNCLAPGIIKTRFSRALWTNDAIAKHYKREIALQQFGTPEQCAGVVAFLASDDAAYVTGETILASGGIPARL
eukprot:TRINITY_DN52904_c0_g1_i1.p1 TRINITY_DN52904_c0_g1~~TRINITY_DN52904_c0_g1_i1.p1  ORF type:complete len:263 (-),score=106.38 TRINITY_DN52904_c0_g1_i1:216-965(-)